jgi:hypothetical protein
MLDLAILPAGPTRYAPLLAAAAAPCDRQAILAHVERNAFGSVLKAYARLADSPVDCPMRREHLRFVRDSRARWARALADLDRAQGRMEVQ